MRDGGVLGYFFKLGLQGMEFRMRDLCRDQTGALLMHDSAKD